MLSLQSVVLNIGSSFKKQNHLLQIQKIFIYLLYISVSMTKYLFHFKQTRLSTIYEIISNIDNKQRHRKLVIHSRWWLRSFYNRHKPVFNGHFNWLDGFTLLRNMWHLLWVNMPMWVRPIIRQLDWPLLKSRLTFCSLFQLTPLDGLNMS